MKSEIEKTVEELNARQAELENKIAELQLSGDAAESEYGKFTAFYEFSAMGYFTTEPDSTICELNPAGAKFLGKDRKDLINCRLNSFLTPESQPDFNIFLLNTLKSDSRQSCEVRIKIENDISAFFQIEGAASGDKKHCYLTAIDNTDRKLAEKTVYNLLNEKEIILKEVHHRVKNNMYNIGALLNMQANAQKEPAAKNVLFDAAGRVQSMSVLYDKLYRSEHAGAVSLKEYLPDLVHEIVGIFPQKKSVKIRTRIDDVVLDAKILSVLGMLVNELITNSMKYAFDGRSDGLINVDASNKENHFVIAVSDNGKGMDESVSLENSTGFGMQLVRMLTEQIGGTIKIERGEGTKFLLEFDVETQS